MWFFLCWYLPSVVFVIVSVCRALFLLWCNVCLVLVFSCVVCFDCAVVLVLVFMFVVCVSDVVVVVRIVMVFLLCC